jgi:hypothetical protein
MILFCCLSLFSCKNTKQSPPANILPKATVEDILLEMCLIDGEMKVLIFNYPIEELKIFMNVRMEQLFTQYHTDYNQFTESYTYYMSDIKTSKQMLEDVTNRLIKRQTEEIGNPNTEKSDN